MSNATPHPDRWFGPCPRTIEDDIFDSLEARIRRETFEEFAKNNAKRLVPVVKTEEQIDINSVSNFDYEKITVKDKYNSECQILWGMAEGKTFFALIGKPFEISGSIVKLVQCQVKTDLSEYLSYLINQGCSVYMEV